MDKFLLLPHRNGYNFSLGYNVISTQAERGMPRQRLDGVGAPHSLSATYKHTQNSQQYFLSFYRSHATKPFLAMLVLDGITHQWYECRFASGLRISTLGESIFTNQVDLVVKPQPIEVSTDEAYVYLYQETDGDPSKFTNLLEVLVNEKLPDAIAGLN